MASYTVSHTDGTTYTIVSEGVADNSLGISLIGQNYRDYGQLVANNFLRLLENQANATPPLNPQAGQLWWNSSTKVLSVFNGNQFKPCSSSAVGTSSPTKPAAGDQWWNTALDQLMAFNGTEWVTVGPASQKGQLFTGIKPTTVVDSNGVSHNIATVQLNGDVAMMVSNDPTFYLPVGHELAGVSVINPGLVLPKSATMTGTSDNALQLAGIPASQYIATVAEASVLDGSLTVNGLRGVVVGSMSIAKDSIGNASLSSPVGSITTIAGTAGIVCSATGTITVTQEPTVDNSVATKLYVDKSDSALHNKLQLSIAEQIAAVVNDSPISTLKALSSAIGNDANYAINTTASLNFKAPKLDPVFTGTPRAPTPAAGDSSTKIATTEFVQKLFSPLSSGSGFAAAGPIIPTVDNTFDIGSAAYRFKTLYGTAMQANYADLAEVYATDAVYRPGTVMVFGGTAEITTSDQLCDSRIAGVISTNPAYLMNTSATGQAVALTGKVPCKVVGPVKKGDILVNSKFAGVATALPPGAWVPGCVIGKSLEDSKDTGIRNVSIVVGRF